MFVRPSRRAVALALAAQNGRLDTMRQLLRAGVSPDGQGAGKLRVLHHAVAGGHVEAIELLLAAGGDPNIGEFRNKPPLMHAIAAGRLDLVDALLAGGACWDHHPRDAIGTALAKWPADRIGELLDRGVPLDVYGHYVAHEAARGGKLDLLEQLVAHGVPLDIRDRDGDTPLLTAIHHGVARVPSYLLSVGADPDARNHAGSTPLIGAAKRGRAPLVRQLLDAGADPTAALPDGTTAADVATGEAADLLSA